MINNLEEVSNFAQLVGKIVGKVERSEFESFGEGFYEFNLAISRLSAEVDTIPVTIPERLLMINGLNLEEGQELAMNGEFRSYNKTIDGKSRLMLHFFAHNIVKEEELIDFSDLDPSTGTYVPVTSPKGANHNLIKLVGYICKDPIYRVTPFNREISDVLMAVNRTKNPNKSFCKSDYIPCIMWGRNARFVSQLPIGSKISIVGRIQSRDYNKKQEDGMYKTKTAYEVSCQSVMQLESETIAKAEEENIG